MAKAPSLIGRLLEEISWGNAVHYRDGGQGFENVLTAEVFQALDFLPRTAFLGRILSVLHGEARPAATLLAQEVEDISFSFLPGDLPLNETLSETGQLVVQPDAVLTSPSVYCLVEAKRIRRGGFPPEQLAREYVATVHKAKAINRTPLFLLVLPKLPPVPINGHGRMEVLDAVSSHLKSVLERAHLSAAPEQLAAQLPSVVAYITWDAIVQGITDASNELFSGSTSVDASVRRLAKAAINAVSWHG